MARIQVLELLPDVFGVALAADHIGSGGARLQTRQSDMEYESPKPLIIYCANNLEAFFLFLLFQLLTILYFVKTKTL